MHDEPGQQSALLVHSPHAATHWVALHAKGGVPPSTGFGTQGAPLQQFALEAHDPPAFTHCAAAHLGTPTLSCLQVSWVSQLPLQQSHDELHVVVFSLHTSPSGLQPEGLRHTPTVAGSVITHVTGIPDPPGSPAEPQQSPSRVHRSPTTWHPLAGWHTSTPVGPNGAHARLQHGPPQAGRPPSPTTTPPSGAEPEQSSPSVSPQLAGPPGGVAAHVPSDWFAAFVHVPVQQSPFAEHASPGCPQNDEAWHVPLLAQSPEQHWALAVHWLPTVLQVALRAAHIPLAQF
jgi:hypothetical protein